MNTPQALSRADQPAPAQSSAAHPGLQAPANSVRPQKHHEWIAVVLLMLVHLMPIGLKILIMEGAIAEIGARRARASTVTVRVADAKRQEKARHADHSKLPSKAGKVARSRLCRVGVVNLRCARRVIAVTIEASARGGRIRPQSCQACRSF